MSNKVKLRAQLSALLLMIGLGFGSVAAQTCGSGHTASAQGTGSTVSGSTCQVNTCGSARCSGFEVYSPSANFNNDDLADDVQFSRCTCGDGVNCGVSGTGLQASQVQIQSLNEAPVQTSVSTGCVLNRPNETRAEARRQGRGGLGRTLCEVWNSRNRSGGLTAGRGDDGYALCQGCGPDGCPAREDLTVLQVQSVNECSACNTCQTVQVNNPVEVNVWPELTDVQCPAPTTAAAAPSCGRISIHSLDGGRTCYENCGTSGCAAASAATGLPSCSSADLGESCLANGGQVVIMSLAPVESESDVLACEPLGTVLPSGQADLDLTVTMPELDYYAERELTIELQNDEVMGYSDTPILTENDFIFGEELTPADELQTPLYISSVSGNVGMCNSEPLDLATLYGSWRVTDGPAHLQGGRLDVLPHDNVRFVGTDGCIRSAYNVMREGGNALTLRSADGGTDEFYCANACEADKLSLYHAETGRLLTLERIRDTSADNNVDNASHCMACR